MTAITHKTCYLYDMSAVESTEVHTLHGLHAFEVWTFVIIILLNTDIHTTHVLHALEVWTFVMIMLNAVLHTYEEENNEKFIVFIE